jgi:F0F1-type ATP synthase assembly protein I
MLICINYERTALKSILFLPLGSTYLIEMLIVMLAEVFVRKALGTNSAFSQGPRKTKDNL